MKRFCMYGKKRRVERKKKYIRENETVHLFIPCPQQRVICATYGSNNGVYSKRGSFDFRALLSEHIHAV